MKDYFVNYFPTDQNVKMIFGSNVGETTLQIQKNLDEYTITSESENTTQIVISGKVLGVEIISPPAGELNTLKVELQITYPDGSNIIVTEWIDQKLDRIKIYANANKGGTVGVLIYIRGFYKLTFELKEILQID